MRFCLQLHGDLPLDAYGTLAAEAESLGFEDVTLHDLLMRRPTWPVLCDIARATSTVQVGPNVTHPYLVHPAVTAASVRHLDEVSGGRAVLGIGRGSMYGMVGMSAPKGLQGLSDAVEVIRRLTTGERAEWAGEQFSLGAGNGLLFGNPRRIPLYFGTFGPEGSRLAGRTGDGVRSAAQWDPDYAVRIRSWVEEGASAAGRDPAEVDFIVENWTCLHPDRDVARREARRRMATFLPHLGPMLEFYRVPEDEVRAAVAATTYGDDAALEAISDTTIDRFMAAGDGGDLRRGLDRLADAGLDAVSFSGSLGPDTAGALQIIGAELGRRSAHTGGTA